MPTAAASRWSKSRSIRFLWLLLLPSLAAAQPERESAPVPEAPTPPPGVEEIVVIGARAGPGVAADEMVSITEFDASALESMGVNSVDDLAAYTPGLEIKTAGSTSGTFFIRGVGLNDFTSNAAGAVAIYYDDVQQNLPAFQFPLLFDLASAEVLKGPQGTGSARNASAGAIKTYTRIPSGAAESYVRGDYGNFGAFDVEGALEVPLLEDRLAGRVAFRIQQRDGFFTNRCGGLSQAQIVAANGQPCSNGSTPIRPGLAEELSNVDRWAGRSVLRFTPESSDMDWRFSVHGERVDQFGTGGVYLGSSGGQLGSPSQNAGNYTPPEVAQERRDISQLYPTPPTNAQCNRPPLGGPPGSPERAACNAQRVAINDAIAQQLSSNLALRPLDTEPFVVDIDLPGYERRDTLGGLLRGEWQLPSATLLSLTGYEHYEREREIDADFSPSRVFEFQIQDDAWQVTQEIGASGELDWLPVEWKTGAYVLIDEMNYEQVQLPGGILPRVDQSFVQKTQSVGVFGQFSWEFLDDLFLDGGVRYNYEHKSFDAEIQRLASDRCAPQTFVTPDCSQVATYHEPTGTVGIRYLLDEDVSTYWKYTHGWKGPQFNARDGLRAAIPIDLATPESIDAFEFGLHGRWFDDRLSLDGAVFWYRYGDYQVFVVTNDVNSPPQRIVQNANDAELYGAELEANLEPVESLLLELRAGWIESKFLDFTDSGFRQQDDPNSDPGVQFFDFTLDYNGNRLPNAPRFKVSASAEYTLDLGRYGAIIPRYEANWSDEVFFDPSEGRGAPDFQTNQPVLPKHAISERSLLLQNARLSYRFPGEGAEICGWVRNLTDQVYKTSAFDASIAAGFVGQLGRRAAHLRLERQAELLTGIRCARSRPRGWRASRALREPRSRARAAGSAPSRRARAAASRLPRARPAARGIRVGEPAQPRRRPRAASASTLSRSSGSRSASKSSSSSSVSRLPRAARSGRAPSTTATAGCVRVLFALAPALVEVRERGRRLRPGLRRAPPRGSPARASGRRDRAAPAARAARASSARRRRCGCARRPRCPARAGTGSRG